MMMIMQVKRFSSRREEVLEYAFQARDTIRVGGQNMDLVSILRSCATIASRLQKIEDGEWIANELLGYARGSNVPGYREQRCFYEINGIKQSEPGVYAIPFGVGELADLVRANNAMRWHVDSHLVVDVPVNVLKRILLGVTERCRVFLDRVIGEVQFAGSVEYLMDEIRVNVDKKIGELDKTISEELESIPSNLSSPNPTDWTKVGHSCRRILRFVADEVFPARKEDYMMKDKTVLKVGSDEFVNRLCAYIDEKASGDTRKFIAAEMNYLRDYLNKVAELSQKNEHGKTIQKIDANMAAIHTYLAISEVLKFRD
jgi:hypothetical protein